MIWRVVPVVLNCVAMIIASSLNGGDGWPVEFNAGLFNVHADYDPQSLRSPEIVGTLANLPNEVAQTLGIQIGAEEVHLILFSRGQEYREYLSKHFPGIVPRQAMFIRRGGPGMVFAYQSDQLATDLRHESTHALLNGSLPYVPLWMDEGIAEYFEAPAHERVSRHPHYRQVCRRSRFVRPPEVHDLENIDKLPGMDANAYRDAWSIIHFLIHESEQSRDVLIRFMMDLQAHSPPGQFSRRLDQELPDWRDRFRTHFR